MNATLFVVNMLFRKVFWFLFLFSFPGAIGPSIIFTNAPAKTTNSPTIEWRSTAPANFMCSLDNAEYRACGGLDTKGQWTGTNLREGRHTLVVQAVDPDGNPGDPARHSWFVGKMNFFNRLSSYTPLLQLSKYE